MTICRNPHAASRVGKITETQLAKLGLSCRYLADRLGVPETKIIYFVTGRHYFPVEFAKPTAEALGIDQGEFIYFILLQYFSEADVDFIWEAVATHVFEQQGLNKGGADDEGKKSQNKKKKKRKKSR